MKSIKVLILHETELIKNMLGSTIEDEEGLIVVAQFSTVEKALAYSGSYQVALISVSLPDQGVLGILKYNEAVTPERHMYFIGRSDAPADILIYIEKGSAGYITEKHDIQELIDRLRMANQEQDRVSNSDIWRMMKRLAKSPRLFSQVENAIGSQVDLTPREQEILELLGQG